MVVQGNEPVSSDYFAEVEDLFFDALELPPTQRDTWLQEKCRDRQEIYTEVQTLLEAHLSSEAFLSESPDLTGIAACPDLSGRRLGSYEVVKEIAKGGMGRIYSADRVDGEYQQRVAIKVVELGNIEAELFRRERQTLANLEHPNIVTLLDGGTLEEGFPYLVMELVEGQTIDRYSLDHVLTTKALAQLFCTLCDAVGHAHQQGVIHCDLKPANILITERGVLKLLDFGISQTLMKTQDAQGDHVRSQALTPEYASPQRQAHQAPHITDDIYSLGIILGQLLIGESLPRVATELLVKKRYKKIDVEQLLVLVPSHELRMIIKKATHETPASRYQSAEQLAADLQNWLQEKPVEAVSGGKHWQFYTLYKNLVRNRHFWMVLLVALFLLGGAAYYWNQQKVAELNANAAAAAKRVSTDLAGVLSRTQPSIDIQAELTGLAIQNIEKTVENAPDNIPAIHVLTESLLRLGQLEGHPLYLSKTDFESATLYFHDAIDRLEDLNHVMALDNKSVGQGDDLLDQTVMQLALLRAKRMLAEIELYEGVKEDGLSQLNQLEAQFQRINFAATSRKQTLVYMHDLLAWSHFNLLKQDVVSAELYLAQAESFIDEVSAVSLLPQEQGEGKSPFKRLKSDDSASPEQQQAQRAREERARARREQQERLKDARFLRAFLAEQRGYIALLNGDQQAALRHYLQVGESALSDIRMTPLINRVNTMQACIALQQKRPAYAEQLLEKVYRQAADLLDAHPSATHYRFKVERLGNKGLSLVERLDCADPRYILFPLHHLPATTS